MGLLPWFVARTFCSLLVGGEVGGDDGMAGGWMVRGRRKARNARWNKNLVEFVSSRLSVACLARLVATQIHTVEKMVLRH